MCRDLEDSGVDFMLVNLFNDNNFRDVRTIELREIAQTRSDSCLDSAYWNKFVMAKVSSHYVNLDSPSEHVRERSEAML